MDRLLSVEHCLSGFVDKKSNMIKARSSSCHRQDVAMICRHWQKVDSDGCSDEVQTNRPMQPPPSFGGFGQGRRKRQAGKMSSVFEYSLSPKQWGALDSSISVSKFIKRNIVQKVRIRH